jgi:Na+/melibiose symporter-like transporter
MSDPRPPNPPRDPSGLGARPNVGWVTMTLYGVGSISNAVKSRGLSAFLMIFYNQVMGLPPAWVGFGTALALVFDALIDPAVGQLSDGTRSRWGRRHPYMYAAAAPVAILFFLIWTPPNGLEPMALFAYMMACLLSIRLFDTFFELPSSALAPELVEDYDKRTLLLSIRVMCSVAGGLGMTIFAYQVALKELPGGGGGVLAKDGYFSYAITGALVIFLTILISSVATHRFIPWLRRPTAGRRKASAHLREIGITLSNRAFFTMVGSGSLVYLVAGITQGLVLYIGLFFWGFSQGQLASLAIVTLAGALIGAALAGPMSRVLGKKGAALLGYIVGAAAELIPYLCRLTGIMPDNGHPAVFAIVAIGNFVNMTAWGMTGVFLTAMIADVVEDNAVKTGRRAEGLLFAADSLFKKIASAGGPAVAGLILSAAHFPLGARKGKVDPQVLQDLMLFYLPVLLAIYVTSITLLAFYNISRESHAANLKILEAMGAEPIGEGA